MRIVRIYSERTSDVWLALVRGILTVEGIDAATIIPCHGVWKGADELSFVLELVLPTPSSVNITRLASKIAKAFEQDEVLVTCQSEALQYGAFISPEGKVRRI
jgi:hypothetical protein